MKNQIVKFHLKQLKSSATIKGGRIGLEESEAERAQIGFAKRSE